MYYNIIENVGKKAIVLICISFVLCTLTGNVYGETKIDPDDYRPQNTTYASNVGPLKIIGNTIIGAIRTVGSFLSIAVLIVLGIKYMAGSIEEKAQYKEAFMPYIIGAAFVFGITNILALIINLTNVFE